MSRLNRLPPAPLSSRSSSARADASPNANSVSSAASSSSHGPANGPTSNESPTTSFISPSLLSADKLYQAHCYNLYAYISSQQKISDLEAENQTLRAQLANSEMKFIGKNKVRKSAKSRATAEQASTHQEMEATERLWDEIKKVAKHYQLFVSPFFEPDLLSIAPPNFKSDDIIRYKNPDNQSLGKTAELYETVPEKYHFLMSVAQSSRKTENTFITHFGGTAGAVRSTSINLIRQILPQIFSLNPNDFIAPVKVKGSQAESTGPQRDQVPQIQFLLGRTVDPQSGVVSYARFPPILYQNPNDLTRVEGRFRNPGLFKIARGVIFGKTFTESPGLAVSRSISQYLLTDTPAATTFGLIAWISVMIRYGISPDTQFTNSGIGGVTKIHYRNDFDFYKRYLIEANANYPKTIQALLQQWDEELFASHNDAKGHTNSENTETIPIDDDDDEMAREMQMLELRSVSPQTGLDEDAGQPCLLIFYMKMWQFPG
ncbi:hypothetical protein BJ912DRAFT_932051 [Pholiota molesta]|nr:hypothetical protein BJ912DRAFT_932051 [Pholiota molesta]